MKAKSMRKWRPARKGLAYRRRHLGEAVNQWRNVAAKYGEESNGVKSSAKIARKKTESHQPLSGKRNGGSKQ
jgi:hypothetical protein